MMNEKTVVFYSKTEAYRFEIPYMPDYLSCQLSTLFKLTVGIENILSCEERCDDYLYEINFDEPTGKAME